MDDPSQEEDDDPMHEGCVQSLTFGSLRVSILRRETVRGALHYRDEDGEAVDITGLMTWPASYAMCEYLVSRAAELKTAAVVELGAGAGLVGMVLGALCGGGAILTDNNPAVLRLLQRNVDHHNTDTENGHRREPLTCQHLAWGDLGSVAACPLYPRGAAAVVASDVVYPDTTAALPDLFRTVDWLLADGAPFLLSYVPRTKAATRQLFATMAAAGFDFAAVPWSAYASQPPAQEAVVLRLTRASPAAPTDPAWAAALSARAQTLFPVAWEESEEVVEEYRPPFAEEAEEDLPLRG